MYILSVEDKIKTKRNFMINYRFCHGQFMLEAICAPEFGIGFFIASLKTYLYMFDSSFFTLFDFFICERQC